MINRLLKNKVALGAVCASLSLSLGLLYRSPVRAQEASEGVNTEAQINSTSSNLEEMNPESETVGETVGGSPAEVEGNNVTEQRDGFGTDAIESETIESETIEITEEGNPPAGTNAESQPTEALAEIDSTLFQNLKSYLDNGELEKADKETFRLLRVLVGEQSERQGYFSLSEWNEFLADESNCPNVQRIDQLWRDSSNGTLGFGEQKRLFEATAGNALNFYRAIGWVEPDGLSTAVEWMRIRVATSADQAIAYVNEKEPNFQNPVSGHLPAAMYWEENENGSHTDRRLALFAKCDL